MAVPGQSRAAHAEGRQIAVVGLSHLGCVIAAAWSGLGSVVRAFDLDDARLVRLASGRAPIYEPELDGALQAGVSRGRLSFSNSPSHVSGATHVFLAYDTPVGEDDSSDISLLVRSLETIRPFLTAGAIVIVSSQLPVGTARQLRTMLQRDDPSLELVYSPENLRLGEAIACYLRPGHIIVGCDEPDAGNSVAELFTVLDGRVVVMDLPSAEMTKHCINTFLATSVTLANQWADICAATGADYSAVAAAIKLDPRIGSRAYVTAGLGFSGGTLGRDLRVLESASEALQVDAPLFGQILDYNVRRPGIVAAMAEEMLGSLAAKTVALLGMTYKPGTSTLHRGIAIDVARDLAGRGARLQAYDPMADWSEMPPLRHFRVCGSAHEAATGSDMVVLLTEWAEFSELDSADLVSAMKGTTVLDTKGVLRGRADELRSLGLEVRFLGLPRQAAGGGRA